jgi:hypothetical protein
MQRFEIGFALLAVLVVVTVSAGQNRAPFGDQKNITVVLNDGREQSIPLEQVARIEFKPGMAIVYKDGHRQDFSKVARIEFARSQQASSFGRNNFLGKWEAGVGPGGGTFFITLGADGRARKSIGAAHGTWVFVDGEARISWDDGWHDIIRKVGSKHQKFAYAPGKSFSDEPSNVTDARNTNPQPI